MESIIRQIILFLGISICVGYLFEFIIRDSRISYSKIEHSNSLYKVKKLDNKFVVLNIVQDDFMVENRKSRVVIELFHNIVPKTAENFLQLCIQNRYAGVPFHRVINGFMIQGGDITNHDGTGGMSIYDGEFEDENFKIKHDCEGLVSMANSGPHTNSSQFFILLGPAHHLDGKHVVFGKVIEGMEHIRAISTAPVDFNDKPIQDIKISYSEMYVND
tara:strand:- start:1625 stop:2275 length:651 start_codon:yes stop_codon:yes gene_type:complete